MGKSDLHSKERIFQLRKRTKKNRWRSGLQKAIKCDGIIEIFKEVPSFIGLLGFETNPGKFKFKILQFVLC